MLEPLLLWPVQHAVEDKPVVGELGWYRIVGHLICRQACVASVISNLSLVLLRYRNRVSGIWALTHHDTRDIACGRCDVYGREGTQNSNPGKRQIAGNETRLNRLTVEVHRGAFHSSPKAYSILHRPLGPKLRHRKIVRDANGIWQPLSLDPESVDSWHSKHSTRWHQMWRGPRWEPDLAGQVYFQDQEAGGNDNLYERVSYRLDGSSTFLYRNFKR